VNNPAPDPSTKDRANPPITRSDHRLVVRTKQQIVYIYAISAAIIITCIVVFIAVRGLSWSSLVFALILGIGISIPTLPIVWRLIRRPVVHHRVEVMASPDAPAAQAILSILEFDEKGQCVLGLVPVAQIRYEDEWVVFERIDGITYYMAQANFDAVKGQFDRAMTPPPTTSSPR